MVTKQGCTVYPVIVPTRRSLKSFNFYLLEKGRSLILVDGGMATNESWQALRTTLAANGFAIDDLSGIIITHHHHDHVGVVNNILEQKDVPIYAHPESVYRLKRDRPFLAQRIDFFNQLYTEMGCGEEGKRQVARLKQAFRENEKYGIKGDILPIRNEQTLEALDFEELKAFETPGHSPDHLVFYDTQRKWLFSGDHLIRHISSNAIVEPDREGKRIRTLIQYIHSLKQCLALDVEKVFPGHGDQIVHFTELVTQRLERIEVKSTKFLQLIANGIRTADQLARTYYKREYKHQFALVMSEVIGHLDYLEAKARVHKVKKDGVWNYYPLE